jgi:hypothetical protein
MFEEELNEKNGPGTESEFKSWELQAASERMSKVDLLLNLAANRGQTLREELSHEIENMNEIIKSFNNYGMKTVLSKHSKGWKKVTQGRQFVDPFKPDDGPKTNSEVKTRKAARSESSKPIPRGVVLHRVNPTQRNSEA